MMMTESWFNHVAGKFDTGEVNRSFSGVTGRGTEKMNGKNPSNRRVFGFSSVLCR